MSRGFRAIALAGMAAAALVPASAHAANLGFGPKTFVSHDLAGGEPLVFADNMHGTLIYTSHEGTTHLYRNGLATTETTWFQEYRNQVNEWYSTNDGKGWNQVQWDPTGAGIGGTDFFQNPAQNTGFSDPDLTQDEGGRVYNTGIDLANDALFSTDDGGKTWDLGTAFCHDGDRPWLAGGKPNEVFLASNTEESGHEVFQSTDGGATCSNSYSSPGGNGKLMYDRKQDALLEPNNSMGLNVWHRGDTAFKKMPGQAYKGPILAHWPAIAIDDGDTTYMVWDTDPRASSGFSCSQTAVGNGRSGAPLPNQIQYAWTKDDGKTWSAPITVAAPKEGRAFWPWIVAGQAGRINITWYQSDATVDLDCQPSSIRIYDASIKVATAAHPLIQKANVSGGPIHSGGVCQGGTTCVATGQDRRLGDFFTNAVDQNGCVMIASGDTTTVDPVTAGPLPYSLPVIFRQTAGSPIRGKGDCSNPAAITP